MLVSALAASAISVFSPTMRAATITVGLVTIEKAAECPSGLAIRFSDGRRCVDKKQQIKLQDYLGIQQKYGYYISKVKTSHGEHTSYYTVVSIDPPYKPGSTYEIADKRSKMAAFSEIAGAMAEGVNQANGVYVPPPYVPPPDTSSPQSNTAGAGYATGLPECVTALYSAANFTQIFSYKNLCSQKITVRYVAIDGAGGSMDLEPAAIGGTGDEPAMMAHRTYSVYACPYGFLAQDMNGNYISTPVTRYKCRSRGY